MQQSKLKIEVVPFENLTEEREVLVIAVEEGMVEVPGPFVEMDQVHGGIVSATLKSGDFEGKPGDGIVLRIPGNNPARICMVGLGKHNEIKEESIRNTFGRNIKKLAELNLQTVSIDLNSFCSTNIKPDTCLELLAEVAHMALWKDTRYKSSDNDSGTSELTGIELLWKNTKEIEQLQKAVERGEAYGEGSNFARELVAMPSNELYPRALARIAKEVAERHDFSITVFGESELEEMGMNAHLAVGRGSAHESCLIVIDTKPREKKKPFALVGKGLTFDSGGISIKPSLNMHEMKGDMAGSAAVLAAIDTLGALNYGERIIAAIPAAENMTGAQAQRPGDIVKACDGTTVEVLNTDAEGRMVLADTLAYIVKEYEPEWIIDLATLTGAIVIALGQWAIGMMGTDDALCDALERAGEKTSERVWRLPLFDEYNEQIKSSIADIQNIGGREAGSITAALFLKHFVKDVPWVHLDIAGVSWINKERDYVPKGPTGIGTRLIADLFLNQLQ